MKKDSFFVKKRKIKIIGYISGESLHPMAGIALIATVGHGMTNKIGVAAKDPDQNIKDDPEKSPGRFCYF